MKSLNILFITTSHDAIGETPNKTGVWLEELSVPFYIFRDAGAVITIASPNGGEVPLDPKSQSIIVATPSTKRFLKDVEAMNFLAHSILLEEVTAMDYDAVFLPGGHGSVWDLIDNKALTLVLDSFINDNKPIGCVSHAVIGLAALQNADGEFLITDKNLTGFSNTEEELRGMTKILPFLVESELRARGATYTKGPDYMSYVVTDGNLITGQNAASAGEVARRVIVLIQDNKYEVPAEPAVG